MALNWVQRDPLAANPTPLPLPEERQRFSASGVTVTLRIPHTLQGPKRTLTEQGSFTVTNKRLIFMKPRPSHRPIPSEGSDDIHMDDLSIPFELVQSTTFNQPLLFGANSISVLFRPSQGGGLPEPSRSDHLEALFEFTHDKVHEVWQLIESARRTRRSDALDENQLPRYEPRSAS